MSNELFGEVVKTISLDFAQKTSPVTVFAKQGDNKTRIIHIQPLMNGVPMNIDTSFQYVAKFAAKKPDGHYVYNDSAKINDDGTITVTLTDQTLAAHGNATCCIMLETQSDDVLTSQNFTLIIEYSAGAYKNLASSDEIMGLDDKLAQVQAMIDRLNREGQTLPPITAADADKVLTANPDGTAGWKDPTGGGLSVTEVSSPEEITADSPDGFYVVPGGGSGECGGGSTGGTPIHYYDSLDAVPADLPEGSFVAVPSSGESGSAKVIDLSDDYHSGLGPVILLLLLSGGNSADKLIDYSDASVGVGITKTLDECDTDQALSIKLSNDNLSVNTNSITKAYMNEVISEVAFNSVLVYNSDIYKFNVCLIKGGLLGMSYTKTALSA